MRVIVVSFVLMGFCGVVLGEERTVIVPKDNKPFSVAQADWVRLTGKGIAGSKIEIKVDGPAKVETTSRVRELVGGRSLLGSTAKEFEVKPTAKGKVIVTISVTPPQPDATAKITKFEFEVR